MRACHRVTREQSPAVRCSLRAGSICSLALANFAIARRSPTLAHLFPPLFCSYTLLPPSAAHITHAASIYRPALSDLPGVLSSFTSLVVRHCSKRRQRVSQHVFQSIFTSTTSTGVSAAAVCLADARTTSSISEQALVPSTSEPRTTASRTCSIPNLSRLLGQPCLVASLNFHLSRLIRAHSTICSHRLKISPSTMGDRSSLPPVDQHVGQDDGYLSSALSSLDDSSDTESDIAELQGLVRSKPPASGSTSSVLSTSGLPPRPLGRSVSMPPRRSILGDRNQDDESDVDMHDAHRASPEISLALLALRKPVIRQQAPSSSTVAILSSVAGLPRASPTAAAMDCAPSLGVRKQKRQRANSIEDSSMLAHRRVRTKTIAIFDGSPDLVDPLPKPKVRSFSGKATVRAKTWTGASRNRDSTSSDESDGQSRSIVRSGSQALKAAPRVVQPPTSRNLSTKARIKHTRMPAKPIKKEDPGDDDMHAQVSSDDELSMFELDDSDESELGDDLRTVTNSSTSTTRKETRNDSQPGVKTFKRRQKGSKKLFGHALLDYLVTNPDSELVTWSRDGKHLFFYDAEAFRKHLNATAGTAMSNFHSLYKQLRNYGWSKISHGECERLKLSNETDYHSEVLVMRHHRHCRSNIAVSRKAASGRVTSDSQSAKSKTRSATLEHAESASVPWPKAAKDSRTDKLELAKGLRQAGKEENKAISGHAARKSSSKPATSAGRASLYNSARHASEPPHSPVRTASKLKQRIHLEKAIKRAQRPVRLVKKASNLTSSGNASGSIDLDYLEKQQIQAARYVADMPDLDQATRRELRFFRRARSPELKCERGGKPSLLAPTCEPQERQQLVIAKVEDDNAKICTLESESKWSSAHSGTASVEETLSESSAPCAQDIDEPVVEKRVILQSTSSTMRTDGCHGLSKGSLQNAELPFLADTQAFCLRYAAATDLHSMRHRSDSLVSTHASDYDVAMTRAATSSVCHSREHSRAWSVTTAGTSVHAEDRDEEDKIHIENFDANSLDGTPLHTQAQSALPAAFTENLRAMRVASGISPSALPKAEELRRDVKILLEDKALQFDEVLSNDTAMNSTKTLLDAEPRDEEAFELTPTPARDLQTLSTENEPHVRLNTPILLLQQDLILKAGRPASDLAYPSSSALFAEADFSQDLSSNPAVLTSVAAASSSSDSQMTLILPLPSAPEEASSTARQHLDASKNLQDTSSPRTPAQGARNVSNSQMRSELKSNSAPPQAPSLCPAEPFDPCPPVPARWLAIERAGLETFQHSLAVPSPEQIVPLCQGITHFDGRWTQDSDGELFMSYEEVDEADDDDDYWEENGIKQDDIESEEDTSVWASPDLWNELMPH